MTLLFLIYLLSPLLAQTEEDIYNLYQLEGPSMCIKLGLTDTCWKNINVKIVDNFSHLSHPYYLIPDWGAGVAIPSENLIILLRHNETEGIPVVALHELAHILVHRKLSGIAIPRWFDEGIAQTLSERWGTQKSVTLAWAVLWRNVIPIEELEHINSMVWIKAELAYAESYNAVLFLTNELKADISEILDSVVATGNFSDGFNKVTGMTTKEFYHRWSKRLFKWYLPFVLIGDQRLPWTLLTLIFLILGFAKIIRYKIRMKKIHEQEIEEHKINEDFYSNSYDLYHTDE